MKKLKNGWVEGSVSDFLELDAADMAYIETKMALARTLKETRTKQSLTQTDLAKRLHTSQSRVARMEGGDPHVSIDLLMRGLFSLGMKRAKLATALK